MILSIMFFEIFSMSSSLAMAIVHDDPSFASFGDIATSPHRSLKGVNLVDLETKVLWFHTTFMSSFSHFPFSKQKSDLVIADKMMPFALSSSTLDSRCLTDAKCKFVPT